MWIKVYSYRSIYSTSRTLRTCSIYSTHRLYNTLYTTQSMHSTYDQPEQSYTITFMDVMPCIDKVGGDRNRSIDSQEAAAWRRVFPGRHHNLKADGESIPGLPLTPKEYLKRTGTLWVGLSALNPFDWSRTRCVRFQPPFLNSTPVNHYFSYLRYTTYTHLCYTRGQQTRRVLFWFC